MPNKTKESIRRQHRTEKRLYQALLILLCVIVAAVVMGRNGAGTLLLKKLHLERKARHLEAENKTLKIDIENLMPPCMKKAKFLITAYEKSEKSCGRWAKYGKTSTGTVPSSFRTAAVDTSVIKPGSLLYAQGIGWMIAEDRGGLIKDRHIDIFMDSVQQAMLFGKKKATVYYQSESCFKQLLARQKYSESMETSYD